MAIASIKKNLVLIIIMFKLNTLLYSYSHLYPLYSFAHPPISSLITSKAVSNFYNYSRTYWQAEYFL